MGSSALELSATPVTSEWGLLVPVFMSHQISLSYTSCDVMLKNKLCHRTVSRTMFTAAVGTCCWNIVGNLQADLLFIKNQFVIVE